ncbi:acyl-CoA N-acyltransferase [Aspergillus unguis]
MTIQVRPAVASDAAALAAINIQAFSTDNGFIVNAFPGIAYEAIHQLKTTRFEQKISHPQTKVFVAVNENGDIVGCARWRVPVIQHDDRGNKVAEAGSGLALPEGTNRGVYDGFFEVIKKKGAKYLRDDDIVLEFIATIPSYQGKGVARALLTWGTEQADAQQKRIFLEATPEGYPVYVKNGWKALERLEIDWGTWGGEGQQTMTLMMRDPLHR